MPTHKCSLEELGLAEGKPSFFPFTESQASYIQSDYLVDKWICADLADVELYGVQSSTYGSSLQIDIVKCSPEDGVVCETDEEKIKDYFSEMFINLLKNQITFDQNAYGEDAVVMESLYDWHYMGFWQQRTVYKVK